MLSFYLCGTNAVDFYQATLANIQNGRFEYKRSETESRRLDQAFIIIYIPDEAKSLLNEYFRKAWRAIRRLRLFGLGSTQRHERLRELCNHPELTLYWARHSFGTIARNNAVSVPMM